MGTAAKSPYQTQLSPEDEIKFQSWVKQNKVPWQDTPTADYDMRGYYKAIQSGDTNARQQKSQFDGKMHFPDTYKTPYHKTFSNESIYATSDAPHWEDNRLVDNNGRVVADETPKTVSTLSPADVMSDPEFLSHDAATQHSILMKVDPEGFGKLDRMTQNSVVARLQQQAGHPAGRPIPAETFPTTGFSHAAQQEAGGLMLAPFELGSQLAQAPVKTTVRFGKELVAQPLRELAGQPQPGESPEAMQKLYPPDAKGFTRPGLGERTFNMLDSLVGGNPAAAREASAQGDRTGALAHLITTPLLTLGVGGLLKTIRKDVAATRREGAALQDISRGAIKGTGPADAAPRVAEMQRVVKQVLQRRGITDDQLKTLFPSSERARQSDITGTIARGNQLILDVARDAVGFVHEPLDAVMTRYGKSPAGAVPKRIAKSMRDVADKAKADGNKGLADAIGGLADNIERKVNFSDLNDVKQNANKMVESVYTSPGAAIDATAERAYAYKLAADTIRKEMYPALQKLSGSSLDLSKLGQREADAIAMRDGIYEHYYKQVAPEQMSKEAAGFWEYTLAGQGAPGHSFYSRHVISRGLEKAGVVPTAGAQLNRQFRRGAGPIGKGMQPERVVLGPEPRAVAGPGAEGLGGVTTRSLTVDGKPMGSVKYETAGDTLTIHHFGGPEQNYNVASNALRRDGLSDLARQISREHPEIKWVQGIRVGGARGEAGRSVRIPMSKLTGGEALPPGVSITPYAPGTVPRFSHPVAKAGAVGRGARAVKGLTPPPSAPTKDDEEE